MYLRIVDDDDVEKDKVWESLTFIYCEKSLRGWKIFI